MTDGPHSGVFRPYLPWPPASSDGSHSLLLFTMTCFWETKYATLLRLMKIGLVLAGGSPFRVVDRLPPVPSMSLNQSSATPS